MKKMTKLLIGAALGLCVSMGASAQARTLYVTVNEPTAGIKFSWQQDSNPTPFVYTIGQSFASLALLWQIFERLGVFGIPETSNA
jgi:hypothetical protein